MLFFIYINIRHINRQVICSSIVLQTKVMLIDDSCMIILIKHFPMSLICSKETLTQWILSALICIKPL